MSKFHSTNDSPKRGLSVGAAILIIGILGIATFLVWQIFFNDSNSRGPIFKTRGSTLSIEDARSTAMVTDTPIAGLGQAVNGVIKNIIPKSTIETNIQKSISAKSNPQGFLVTVEKPGAYTVKAVTRDLFGPTDAQYYFETSTSAGFKVADIRYEYIEEENGDIRIIAHLPPVQIYQKPNPLVRQKISAQGNWLTFNASDDGALESQDKAIAEALRVACEDGILDDATENAKAEVQQTLQGFIDALNPANTITVEVQTTDPISCG